MNILSFFCAHFTQYETLKSFCFIIIKSLSVKPDPEKWPTNRFYRYLRQQASKYDLYPTVHQKSYCNVQQHQCTSSAHKSNQIIMHKYQPSQEDPPAFETQGRGNPSPEVQNRAIHRQHKKGLMSSKLFSNINN